MEKLKTVIVSDGSRTMLFYNGKAYAEFITGVEFTHIVPDNPELKITSDKIPLPKNGTLEIDTFKKFLEHVMTDSE